MPLSPVFKSPDDYGLNLHCKKYSVPWIDLILLCILSLPPKYLSLINSMISDVVHKRVN